MKQCKQCKEWKSIERFTRRAINGKEYYRGTCKDCENEYIRQHKDKEKHREYQRQFRIRGGEVLKQRQKAYDQKPEVRARKAEQQKLPEVKKRRYEARKARYHLPRNNMVHNARAAVRRAIKNGILPKVSTLICSNCNINQAIHYHHYAGYDIENRLNVMPVCQNCHLILDGFREA